MRTPLIVATLAVTLAALSPAASARPGDSRSVRAAGTNAKTITLDVQDAEVKHVLLLLADTAGRNLVISDNVTGKVTLKLRSVPWDAALRVVLAAKDLGAVVEDDIIRVATRAQLDEETRRRLDDASSCEEKGPLVTRMIPVNYAKAAELRPLIEATLTKRGTVSVDERTNVLIVRDVICP
jgi:type IV pilus assembly protein PilQ